MSHSPLTLGIEEEYQIIDPETRELKSYIQELLEQGQLVLHDQIKQEFLQSQVEVGSSICHNIQEVREEVVRLRTSIHKLAASNGLRVAAASTHPFSAWLAQDISIGERYSKLRTDMAELARRMLIFGMHVHVGIDDKELMVDVMNQARYFLPHLLALTTSSPFWVGRDTGLKSYRTVIFESLPRTGLPPNLKSWADYEEFIQTLVSTHCIDEPTKIWWDVRPHPKFPTLEFRVCDICTKIDEAVCIAALVQAIVAKLIKLRLNNQSWRTYRHHLVTENKWRAVRYGVQGNLIDFGRQAEVPMKTLAHEMLEFVDDVVDDLGSRSEVEYVHTILEGGTSADRQLEVYRQTNDFKAVVDHLVAETREGCNLD
ncbi:MAG: carboxylate-amine ligase [Acidobacteriota bacterium]